MLPANETILALAARFPRCFSLFERERWPLKIGIYEDIRTAAPDIAVADVLFALRIYCANPCYLRRSQRGVPRIDLQGRTVGAVTSKEAAHAKRRLERQQVRKRERPPKAERRSAPRKAGQGRTFVRRLGLADLKAAALARRSA
jgi:ProP effector